MSRDASMIEVQKLTKQYSGRIAVDSIDFEVGKGEIVGFLGPNGAGKSTTMRMLTCYLSATSGSARVAGFDIFEDSIAVRRHIGYMPENVPLYPDMRVREFLEFRARLKGMRQRDARRAVAEVAETCGLEDVFHRMIATLSKGYRQRVGLADALVHRPDLLILDEPTNGLDPNQIRHSRELIRRLGERHTILLSTHILSEVEMTCERVVIIDRGRIRASDSPQNLIRRLRKPGELLLEATGSADRIEASIREVDGVDELTPLPGEDGWFSCRIGTDPEKDVREAIFERVTGLGGSIRELASRTASLEDAFVDLVKHDGPDPRDGGKAGRKSKGKRGKEPREEGETSDSSK